MKEIIERRSIRKYRSDTISKEDIDTIIQAGMKAPSAKNRQPWKYIVYTAGARNQLLNEMERGLLRERDGKPLLPKSQNGLADAFYTLHVMREAPVLIMIVNTNGQSPFEDIDADERVTEICDTLSIGASVQNMLLTATELGYGTLWIANTCFAYKELVAYMGITGQLIGAVSLGLPAEKPNPRPRKSMEETVEYRA
ncbi:MAG: nitroreductase family protein [Lachnospiraceae bacterium]|nr:nitroreductase family protein [Lachnospiraceae bacterium]